MATGEFVALLDHDDLITPDALYHVVKALNAEPSADFLYSDEDKISPDGIRFEPFFKPDWSPELLRTIPYISHLTVIRKSLIDNIGGFDERFRHTPDYDLQLRAISVPPRAGGLSSKSLHSIRSAQSLGRLSNFRARSDVVQKASSCEFWNRSRRSRC